LASGTSSSSSATASTMARTASWRGSGSSAPLLSACSSSDTRVSCWPLPATQRRCLKPAWLSGVPALPPPTRPGEGGVIWLTKPGRRRCVSKAVGAVPAAVSGRGAAAAAAAGVTCCAAGGVASWLLPPTPAVAKLTRLLPLPSEPWDGGRPCRCCCCSSWLLSAADAPPGCEGRGPFSALFSTDLSSELPGGRCACCACSSWLLGDMPLLAAANAGCCTGGSLPAPATAPSREGRCCGGGSGCCWVTLSAPAACALACASRCPTGVCWSA
jgi:hypothetical protein